MHDHLPPESAITFDRNAQAKAAGLSHRSVQRIWAAHGLQPHRVKAFKLSNDAKFAAKMRDVVGLYVNPPEHALVLSVDEKSQIQALDRTQPGLPLKRGYIRCIWDHTISGSAAGAPGGCSIASVAPSRATPVKCLPSSPALKSSSIQ